MFWKLHSFLILSNLVIFPLKSQKSVLKGSSSMLECKKVDTIFISYLFLLEYNLATNLYLKFTYLIILSLFCRMYKDPFFLKKIHILKQMVGDQNN